MLGRSYAWHDGLHAPFPLCNESWRLTSIGTFLLLRFLGERGTTPFPHTEICHSTSRRPKSSLVKIGFVGPTTVFHPAVRTLPKKEPINVSQARRMIATADGGTAARHLEQPSEGYG